jgi:hypothetical protein
MVVLSTVTLTSSNAAMNILPKTLKYRAAAGHSGSYRLLSRSVMKESSMVLKSASRVDLDALDCPHRCNR